MLFCMENSTESTIAIIESIKICDKLLCRYPKIQHAFVKVKLKVKILKF